MNASQKAAFIRTVRGYYRKSGRHDLPWRQTSDPYRIAVSEVMLQQTQVARVIGKYKEFLKAFPTARSLANAPLRQVLLLWSGLGYNRRARFLQKMAQAVVAGSPSSLKLRRAEEGKFPKTFDELLQLPGVGRYTAGAIMAFAYNRPMAMIETNIRTVYLHHFFKNSTERVSDAELLPLIEQTLDHKNPRQWYWALMDYGSHLKSQGVHIHRKSAQYQKQAAFKGSLRQVRGAVVKILTTQSVTVSQLKKETGFEQDRIEQAVQSLFHEGLIIKKGQKLAIS